jgi:hypothetical protein
MVQRIGKIDLENLGEETVFGVLELLFFLFKSYANETLFLFSTFLFFITFFIACKWFRSYGTAELNSGCCTAESKN